MPQTKQLVVAMGVLTLIMLFGLAQILGENPVGNSAAVVLFGEAVAPVVIEAEPMNTRQTARERLLAQLRAGAGGVIEVPQGIFPEATTSANIEETPAPEAKTTDHCLTDEIQDSGCVSTAQIGAIESVWLGFALDGKLVFSNSEGGQNVSASNLDSCGGHEHPTLWEGQVVMLYHYHTLDGSLVSIGCLPPPTAVETPLPVLVDATTTITE